MGGGGNETTTEGTAAGFGNYAVRFKFFIWWVSSSLSNRALLPMGDFYDSGLGLAEIL